MRIHLPELLARIIPELQERVRMGDKEYGLPKRQLAGKKALPAGRTIRHLLSTFISS